MSGLASTYLTESVSVVAKGSLLASGQRAFDGGTTAALAKTLDRVGLLITFEGKEVTYERIFYIDSTVTVSVGDRIVYGGTNHEVLAVETVRGIDGILDHRKVYTGRR